MIELKQLRRQVRKEARVWGLSENDLLSLIVSLSETVRDQVPGASQFDTKQVVKWIRHPMFPLMLQWISSSVINLLSNNDAPPSKQEESSIKTPHPWPTDTPGTPVPAPRHAVPWLPPGTPGQGYARPGAPVPKELAPEAIPPASHFHFY